MELPWGVKGSAVAHWFWTDEGSRDLGSEIDLVLSKKINPNWSVLIKGAHFDGTGGQPDISRAWFQTEFKFLARPRLARLATRLRVGRGDAGASGRGERLPDENERPGGSFLHRAPAY